MERKKFKTAPYKVMDESKPRVAGQYWCPYCGEFRFFKIKVAEGYARCTDCNISLQDYWVKNANHLWETIKKDRR